MTILASSAVYLSQINTEEQFLQLSLAEAEIHIGQAIFALGWLSENIHWLHKYISRIHLADGSQCSYEADSIQKYVSMLFGDEAICTDAITVHLSAGVDIILDKPKHIEIFNAICIRFMAK